MAKERVFLLRLSHEDTPVTNPIERKLPLTPAVSVTNNHAHLIFQDALLTRQHDWNIVNNREKKSHHRAGEGWPHWEYMKWKGRLPIINPPNQKPPQVIIS